jgi:ketosteroid isomerase-like protein
VWGLLISVRALDCDQQQRGGTPMASNIDATRKAYELFQRGDIPALIKEMIDENCTWISPGPKDKLPWAGTFKGKQEIANFFAHVGENLEFSEFVPREMIEQGDTVVVLGTLTGRAKKTGKTVKNEWAHVFKFSQGKAVFFQEYIDTAADVLAMS